jgi:hypothetical protein
MRKGSGSSTEQANPPQMQEGATREGTGAAANEKRKNEKETANKSNSWQENKRISAKISEEVGSEKAQQSFAGRSRRVVYPSLRSFVSGQGQEEATFPPAISSTQL